MKGNDSVTGLVEAYADKNAGSAKTISVAAYTVGDNNNGNDYTVTTIASITGVINQASLTLTPTTITKVYDSKTGAAATPTISGIKGTDTATGLTEIYADANVGTGKILSIAAYTINDGNGGNNYSITLRTNSNGRITPASLTIAAVANLKIYDSSTSAAAVPTVSGLIGKDTVTNLTEVYGSANAGTQTLSVYTGPALSATLTGISDPQAMAIDAAGNLYVATYPNSVSRFAPGATTPNATLTGVNNPTALAIDGNGTLYVANFNSNTVSKYAPAPSLLALRSRESTVRRPWSSTAVAIFMSPMQGLFPSANSRLTPLHPAPH